MNKRHLILFCFILLIAAPMVGADLKNAKELEKAGKTEEAFKFYKVWLLENKGSRDFSATLNHALEISGGVDDEIALLSEHLYSIDEPSGRYFLLKRLAVLEEYTGSLSDAQIHYELASFIDPANRDFKTFLYSALILFELGDAGRSEAQANTLIRLSADPVVSFKGKLLLARIYAFQGRLEELDEFVIELAASIDNCCATSLSYFTLHELARRAGISEVMVQAETALKEQFTDSVETALLSGKGGVDFYPSPGLYLSFPENRFQMGEETLVPDNGNSEEAADVSFVGIQTGSFTVKENAEYMIIDLQNAGFSPALEETDINVTKYYKVIIPDIPFSESQEMMIHLKENGFEGFMVFP